MAVYEWRGIAGGSGKEVKGLRDAENVRALRTLLRKDGVILTQALEEAVAKKKKAREVDFGRYFRRVSALDVSMATRQLATLLKSGVPLVESMNALIDQLENAELKAAFTQTRVAAPTAKSAGTAPVRRLANVWGTAGPGGFTKVWTEVRMSNGSWSKSQQTVTAFNGGYVLPLTYGSTVPGTYSWRVAAEYPGIGVIRSATFTFVRTA